MKTKKVWKITKIGLVAKRPDIDSNTSTYTTEHLCSSMENIEGAMNDSYAQGYNKALEVAKQKLSKLELF